MVAKASPNRSVAISQILGGADNQTASVVSGLSLRQIVRIRKDLQIKSPVAPGWQPGNVRGKPAPQGPGPPRRKTESAG